MKPDTSRQNIQENLEIIRRIFNKDLLFGKSVISGFPIRKFQISASGLGYDWSRRIRSVQRAILLAPL